MLNRSQKTSRVLGRYTGEEAVRKIYDFLLPIYIKKPKKLREDELTLLYVVLYIDTMNQGGFEHFYLSEFGNLASDVTSSFSIIDMDPAYDLVYQSMQVFSGMISKEQMIRKIYIDEHLDICTETWQPLDERFKTIEPQIYNKLIDFIRENIIEFR